MPNEDLKSIVEEASSEVLKEARVKNIAIVKKVIAKITATADEIKKLRNQLDKAEKSLKKQQEKLDMLKDGKWDILAQIKQSQGSGQKK